MDKLTKLSMDKALLKDVESFMLERLSKEIIAKTLRKEDTSGYAEAHGIIKKSIHEIDLLTKKEKKNIKINQSE